MDADLTRARAYYYEFFAIPLFFDEKDTMFSKWKKQLNYLKSFAITDDDAKHFQELEKFDFDMFKAEQNSVLYDFSYTNVPLNASFYDKGRDDGNIRRLVISTLRKSTFRRNEDFCKDNEDYIGFIFYTMSTFLMQEIDKSNFLSTELFVNSLNPIIDEFMYLLSNNKNSIFFKHLSALMQTFFSAERSILAIEKPAEIKHIAQDALKKLPEESKFNNVKKRYDFDSDLTNA